MREDTWIKRYADAYQDEQEINFSGSLNSTFNIPFVMIDFSPFVHQVEFNDTTYQIYGPLYYVLREVAIKFGAR